MQRLTGIGVSPGAVCGRAVILIQRLQVLRYQIAPARLERELGRLEESRVRTREQLVDIREGLGRRRGPELAALFDAQLLMLDDPLLLPRAAALVREQRTNAEWAVQQVFEDFSAVFEDVRDPYLRERKGDVADLVGRLRMNLRRRGITAREMLSEVEEASVLVADELTPSLAAQVDWTKVRGFATDAGSRTYHTAILARALEVPAVVGLHDASRIIQPGQFVAIDGTANEVIIDPDEATIFSIRRAEHNRLPADSREGEPCQPATTADGLQVRLEANVEFPDEVAAARYAGAEGIGLYRSEFLLTEDAREASEDAQFEVYRRMLEAMAPAPVTVRTFDIDEDELARRTGRAPSAFSEGWIDERVSRQGLRGLRLGLRRPDLLKTQLRALLRAARHGSLRIMFPFVSSVGELRDARRIVDEVTKELSAGGAAPPRVPIGVMIEIPAAAYTADLLAREADFLTIGTNDLIQYCLAVDRSDERVSRLYAPLHPAILRIIVTVQRAAAARRRPVSLCGEMASDPALLALLVGLGLREFSMAPGAITVARQMLAEVRSDDLRALAKRALRLNTADAIEEEVLATLGRMTPDLKVGPTKGTPTIR